MQEKLITREFKLDFYIFFFLFFFLCISVKLAAIMLGSCDDIAVQLLGWFWVVARALLYVF